MTARWTSGSWCLLDDSANQMTNIFGALLPESLAVLAAVGGGANLAGLQDQELAGVNSRQCSWRTRRRSSHADTAGNPTHGIDWCVEDQCRAAIHGVHNVDAPPLLDARCGELGRQAPTTLDDFVRKDSAWRPDGNDGIRVNIAPAFAERATWLADERRWVREGLLIRPGWWS